MPSDLDAHMANNLDPQFSLVAGEMIDRLCDEFEDGWLAGRPVPLEDIVRAAPGSARPELFRELLAIERALRERDGKPLTVAEAHRRFTEFGSWVVPIIEGTLSVTTISQAPHSSERPDFVGGYRVVRELGRGGMGVVYLVDDPLGDRQLAVKMMLPEKAADQIARERFLREARSASAVEHDNVVAIYEVKEDRGTPYLVMPLLRGETLQQRLKRESKPPLELVLKVGCEMALGLAAAHEKRLVHRDVKPSNTWLEGDPTASTLDAQVRRVKVLDFGLARPTDGTDGLSATGTVVGTPTYMAPEQARGERVDARADLFSLGAILYRMAAGVPAFSGPTLTAVLTAIATHQPPPAHAVNPLVPTPLSQLIGRLLAKEPNERPQSAREVIDALTAIKKESPLARSRDRRQHWMALGGLLLALCVGAVAARSMFIATTPGTTPRSEAKETRTANSGDQRAMPPQSESLRVKSLDVMHYAQTPNGDVPRGVLGRDSFSPLLGDKVQVVAQLSRPAYAYIIAFRPDGVAELCFPDDEDTPPPLTDTPRYPAANSGKAYGLREGTGLWVFAVVASEKPLPSYRQWLASHTWDWKRLDAPTRLVWWYDGAVLETLLEGRDPIRAKDEELTGPAASVRALGRRLGQPMETSIGVIGFGVGQRN